MEPVVTALEKLKKFYDENVTLEEIKELYEGNTHSNIGENGPTDGCRTVCDLPFVRHAIDAEVELIPSLQELSTILCNLCESVLISTTNWNELIQVAPREQYLAFIYALVGLHSLDITCRTYTQIAVAAARTYFLTLTVPGAKGFHIFEEAIIVHALQVFTIIDKIQDPEFVKHLTKQHSTEIWVSFASLCEGIKYLLRNVHFDKCTDVRNSILREVIEMHHHNYVQGYASTYSARLHRKSFEILDEMLHEHNGDVEETLMKILYMTLVLHTHPPRPKCNSGSGAVTGGSEFDHISDWFIKCIEKHPDILPKILGYYIEWVITNPNGQWKNDQIQRALEYAAKYDAALFLQCNVSCEKLLCEAIYDMDVGIRARSIDLIAKMLLLESNTDWEMFRQTVLTMPREILLIKELILSIQDNSNQIKFKAAQTIHQTLERGSLAAKHILTEGLRYAQFSAKEVVLPKEPYLSRSEIRYRKPNVVIPTQLFLGWEVVEDAVLHMPEYIYGHLYRNNIAYIRRAGVILIHSIAKLNPLVIYNTNFVEETSRLANEVSAIVRKQTLLMVDSVMQYYPNCYPVILVWCTVIAPMCNDEDPKNIEHAMECFCSKVFSNVRTKEQTKLAEHFMPWMIIRTLLEAQLRPYLQYCFQKRLKPQMLNAQMFSTIESHTTTWYCMEAWVLLNFIAGKIKSKEPDAIIEKYLWLESKSLINESSIAIEVLCASIQHFSPTALNYIFNHMLNKFHAGSIQPPIVSKVFEFVVGVDRCRQSYMQSSAKPKHKSLSTDYWVTDLNKHLEKKILSEIESASSHNRPTPLCTSYLHAYSVVNVTLQRRPNRRIVSYIHSCINEYITIPQTKFSFEIIQKLNTMIIVSGRLAMRDPVDVSTTCMLYGRILKSMEHPGIVDTTIIAATDLSKKHMQTVELIMDEILAKLSSMYVVNRKATFKCVTELVLQDHLKLRGTLLLALLAVILDDDKDLSEKAIQFFTEYLSTKNSTLFQKCIIECPFVLNEYANCEDLDTFAETAIKSPLKGNDNRRKRYALYNHLMHHIEEIPLILTFDNLKVLAEKSQTDSSIKTPEGISLVTDVLFILRRICKITKEKKSAIGNSEKDSEHQEAETVEIANETPPTSGSTQASAKGKGRRREVTMADALIVVEKSLTVLPIILQNTRDSDPSIEKSVNCLAIAIMRRFPNLVQYAQPQEFWDKYRTSSDTTKVKKGQCSTEFDDDDDDDGTDDLPLPIVKPSLARQINDLPLDLRFNLNI